jgi:hypothetical protein
VLEDALKVFDSYGIGESFYEAKDMTNSVFAASAGVFQFVGSNLKNMNPSGSIRAISDAHQIGADRDRL